MPKVLVTPKEGLNVLDPATGKPIPKDGAVFDRTPYWLRRQRHGEVTLSEPKQTTRARSAKTREG